VYPKMDYTHAYLYFPLDQSIVCVPIENTRNGKHTHAIVHILHYRVQYNKTHGQPDNRPIA